MFKINCQRGQVPWYEDTPGILLASKRGREGSCTWLLADRSNCSHLLALWQLIYAQRTRSQVMAPSIQTLKSRGRKASGDRSVAQSLQRFRLGRLCPGYEGANPSAVRGQGQGTRDGLEGSQGQCSTLPSLGGGRQNVKAAPSHTAQPLPFKAMAGQLLWGIPPKYTSQCLLPEDIHM